MFKLEAQNEDTLFLNISEVRARLARLAGKIKGHPVVVMKNGRPALMMVDYEEYQRLQRMVEERENDYFSEIAMDRTKNLKDKDLLSHEEVLRKFRK